jgi:hypothetical protein
MSVACTLMFKNINIYCFRNLETQMAFVIIHDKRTNGFRDPVIRCTIDSQKPYLSENIEDVFKCAQHLITAHDSDCSEKLSSEDLRSLYYTACKSCNVAVNIKIVQDAAHAQPQEASAQSIYGLFFTENFTVQEPRLSKASQRFLVKMAPICTKDRASADEYASDALTEHSETCGKYVLNFKKADRSAMLHYCVHCPFAVRIVAAVSEEQIREHTCVDYIGKTFEVFESCFTD